MLLMKSRKAAEQVVQEALRQLEEPPLISCTGSAGPLPRGAQPSCKPESPGVLRCHLKSSPTSSVAWGLDSSIIQSPQCGDHCFSRGVTTLKCPLGAEP